MAVRISINQFSQDPHSGVTRGHHLHESGLQKALKQAVRKAGVEKRASCLHVAP